MATEELVDIVDDHDQVVGVATVGECLEKGMLHRAVAVLVERANGKLVLQQRNRKDAWHPGLWTISCTGHVKRGESYPKAAARELFEELGITAELSNPKKYLIPPIESGRLTEREWVCFFLAKTDAPLTIDTVELEKAEEVSEPGLRRMIEDNSLTPDAVLILTDHLHLKASF